LQFRRDRAGGKREIAGLSPGYRRDAAKLHFYIVRATL
jgi:hypothetical protein